MRNDVPAISSVIRKLRRWRDTSVSRGELARLDARMLADLGMTRCDIDRVVRGLK